MQSAKLFWKVSDYRSLKTETQKGDEAVLVTQLVLREQKVSEALTASSVTPWPCSASPPHPHSSFPQPHHQDQEGTPESPHRPGPVLQQEAATPLPPWRAVPLFQVSPSPALAKGRLEEGGRQQRQQL